VQVGASRIAVRARAVDRLEPGIERSDIHPDCLAGRREASLSPISRHRESLKVKEVFEI
jgi:hypothetical protein